jgi:hypothetical protein
MGESLISAMRGCGLLGIMSRAKMRDRTMPVLVTWRRLNVQHLPFRMIDDGDARCASHQELVRPHICCKDIKPLRKYGTAPLIHEMTHVVTIA